MLHPSPSQTRAEVRRLQRRGRAWEGGGAGPPPQNEAGRLGTAAWTVPSRGANSRLHVGTQPHENPSSGTDQGTAHGWRQVEEAGGRKGKFSGDSRVRPQPPRAHRRWPPTPGAASTSVRKGTRCPLQLAERPAQCSGPPLPHPAQATSGQRSDLISSLLGSSRDQAEL